MSDGSGWLKRINQRLIARPPELPHEAERRIYS